MQSDISVTFVPRVGDDGLPLDSLPRECYTTPEWFQRDMDMVFRRRWLFVCHVSEIPNSGDYVSYEIAKESVIVARDRKGGVNAFHNVCRHRGIRFVEPGKGNVKVFICEFHLWTYNLDGTLRGAPRMPGLDKSCYGAKSVQCEVWNGMVFINLMEEPAKPVAGYLCNVDLRSHHLDRVKVIATREYRLKANWKINFETYTDSYHVEAIHANTINKILDMNSETTAYDNTDDELHNREDFFVFSDDMRDGAFFPGMSSQTFDGHPVCRKNFGDGVTVPPPKLVAWTPSFSVAAFPDYGYIFDWIPISTNETLFRNRWIVHEDAIEGVDYEIDEVTAFVNAFNQEDTGIVAKQQLGVESMAYVPGPYQVPLEQATRLFVGHYLSMVGVI
jgi:phenylpropionate dioxygenase-like ring-hydroxylating dioxygenase large terminal subunit